MKWEISKKLPRFLFALAVVFLLAFISQPARAQIYTTADSAAFSTSSRIYAILPGHYTVQEKLCAVRPAKSDPGRARVSDLGYDQLYTFSCSFAPYISKIGITTCDFGFFCRKAWQQACLLLDVPPPAL